MSRDKEGMARDIETSLKNFRTDYIDLYQVHNPNLKQLEQVMRKIHQISNVMKVNRPAG
jgi:aryl-alcohol dehydrogenase-like predicted oxidoreductase